MKYLLYLSIFLIPFLGQAADTLNIIDAIAKRRISVETFGGGGLGANAARLTIINNISTALQIEVPAGLMLNSVDPDAQDLLILEDAILFVKGRTSANLQLYGDCTQMSNYCPKEGEAYTLGDLVAPELLAIANIINDNELQSRLGQHSAISKDVVH